MKTRNLTPFDVLVYSALTKDEELMRVVAMRTDFRLVPNDTQIEPQNFKAIVIDRNPPALLVEDQFWDNTVEVKHESDLAPYKPKVDVLVHGKAYAPAGKAATTFMVSLRIITTQPEHAQAMSVASQELLCKTLRINGARFFHKEPPQTPPLADTATDDAQPCQCPQQTRWRLTKAGEVLTLPLRYAYTYGGECKILNPATEHERKQLLARLDEAVLISPSQRRAHPDGSTAPLAHTYEPLNPVGIGFVQSWYLKASQCSDIPVPQIVYPDQSWNEEEIDTFVQACDTNDRGHPLRRPAGFGAIGRTWQPRIDKAGTYDECWLQERHPYLPEDFDFAYWNCAPEDQQIDELPVDAHIELTNMNESGKIAFDLPGHRAFLLLRYESGAIIPRRMLIDTCIIDAETLTVSLVWRGFVSDEEAIRVLEVRYETDINAPLVKFKRNQRLAPEGQAHG